MHSNDHYWLHGWWDVWLLLWNEHTLLTFEGWYLRNHCFINHRYFSRGAYILSRQKSTLDWIFTYSTHRSRKHRWLPSTANRYWKLYYLDAQLLIISSRQSNVFMQFSSHALAYRARHSSYHGNYLPWADNLLRYLRISVDCSSRLYEWRSINSSGTHIVIRFLYGDCNLWDEIMQKTAIRIWKEILCLTDDCGKIGDQLLRTTICGTTCTWILQEK